MGIKKENLKNIGKDILIFIFISIVCFSNIFVNSIGNLDEIWNYNFSRNVANGLVPYRDFNMVQMPLLAIFCGVILKIFGNQLIVMRLLAVILMSTIFFMVYKILKLTVKKGFAELLVIMILVIFKDVMCIDYNYAVLLISLVLLYIEIKNEKYLNFEYDFKYNLMLGLIAGLAILCKQTTGLAVALACIGYKILAIRKKEDIKPFIQIAFTRILGCIIPIIIFIIYLAANNAVNDFFSYTILGIKTFSNSIKYETLFRQKSIMLSLLAAIVPITIVFMFVMLFTKDISQKMYVFFAYSISSFLVAFPISDKIHFLTGSLITILAIIYLIYIYGIEKKIEKFKAKSKMVIYSITTFASAFLILSIMIFSMQKIKTQYIDVNKEKELNHFINIPESQGLKERIIEIDNYILACKEQGKNVYILDAEAAIYTIPIDIYNKDYDMFLKGNLGADGENGIITRIQNERNAIYLIKKDNLNWQNPNNVREYIINNLKNIGEISIFYIYERNDV